MHRTHHKWYKSHVHRTLHNLLYEQVMSHVNYTSPICIERITNDQLTYSAHVSHSYARLLPNQSCPTYEGYKSHIHRTHHKWSTHIFNLLLALIYPSLVQQVTSHIQMSHVPCMWMIQSPIFIERQLTYSTHVVYPDTRVLPNYSCPVYEWVMFHTHWAHLETHTLNLRLALSYTSLVQQIMSHLQISHVPYTLSVSRLTNSQSDVPKQDLCKKVQDMNTSRPIYKSVISHIHREYHD